jgi:beta-1,4-mannosyltransferase
MLVQALPESVEVASFSWRRAFFSRYDVLHVHWPEYLLRGRPGRGATLKRALFALMLVRTTLLRVPTVWTVHNERPHERVSPIDRLLLAIWARRATRRVYMYRSAVPDPADERNVCIPRGDYEPVYGGLRRSDQIGRSSRSRLLFFGVLRPYKGIERLIDVVREAGDGELELLITGGAFDEAYARELEARADGARNVTLRIGFLSDGQLAEVIQSSAVVVLPYLDMYNSGAALLSLTLHRPIVVPGSPTMRELRSEVGADWVFLYEDSLTVDDLRQALRQLTVPPASRPDLSRRNWAHVGRSYARLYESIVRCESAASADRGSGLRRTRVPDPR